MARTAPLSRRFYDTFGDENTNELVGLLNTMDATYLAELRALNEANAVRFESKLDQRIADVRAEFRTALADLRAHVDIEFRSVRAEMQVGFANVRGEMQAEFAKVRGEMTSGFEGVRREIEHANTVALRWFVGLTVTTLVTVAGTLIAAALR